MGDNNGSGQGAGAGQGAGQGGQGQGAGEGQQGQGQGQGAGQGQQGAGQGQQGAGQGGQGQGGQGAGQGDAQGQQGATQGGQGQGTGQQDGKISITELETALGMPLADAKALLVASKKKDAPRGEPLKGADLKIAKMEALMLRKVPSEKIPVILQHLNIAGESSQEINDSIDALIEAKILSIDSGQGGQGQGQGQQGAGQGGQGQGQQGGGGSANGAGNQGLQNGGNQQKKIWTVAEVRDLRINGGLTDAILADIKKAEAEGRVKE